MNAPNYAALHSAVLARNVRLRLPDPSPRMDASETDVVRDAFGVSREAAERYVAKRLAQVLGRLDNPVQRESAWAGGPIALGAYVTLCELTGEPLPTWAVSS